MVPPSYLLSATSYSLIAKYLEMRDFSQLEVWRKSKDLVMAVYQETARFPSSEQYVLCSQLRRAAVSVTANIAEGTGRGSDQDFARFLEMALGSTAEARSHILLAEELGYLKPETKDTLSEKTIEIGRMLSGLIETLRNSQ